jgi:hypothetical protein
MTLLSFIVVSLVNTAIFSLGIVFGKTWLDKRFNASKPTVKLPPPSTGA